MRCNADRSKEPNNWSDGWDTHGEHRKIWSTFGALRHDLNKISASWELTSHSLSPVLSKASHRSNQALSRTGLGKDRSAQKWNISHIDTHERLQSTKVLMRNHFRLGRIKPMLPPSLTISAMSAATMSASPQSGKSSRKPSLRSDCKDSNRGCTVTKGDQLGPLVVVPPLLLFFLLLRFACCCTLSQRNNALTTHPQLRRWHWFINNRQGHI